LWDIILYMSQTTTEVHILSPGDYNELVVELGNYERYGQVQTNYFTNGKVALIFFNCFHTFS
jgi:hypothetical protein